MKTLLFTAVMLLAMASISYGKPKQRDAKLFTNLSRSMNQTLVKYTSSNDQFTYSKFEFNGKIVKAFYDPYSSDLIGFSIPMDQKDLSADALANIAKKYSSYSISEVLMFIRQNGSYEFFASLTKAGKPTVAIKISPNGKPRYYATMQGS